MLDADDAIERADRAKKLADELWWPITQHDGDTTLFDAKCIIRAVAADVNELVAENKRLTEGD